MQRAGVPSDLVRSVSRALRVLEEVGEHPDGINPKRLASRCGLHLSTVYHLVRTLRYEGYLERLPSGDYVLGLAIAERFRDLVSALEHPAPVPAVLRELAATTGHTAYLARFVEGRVTITGVVEAPGSPHLEDLIVGFNDAAHATALGKALLSTLSDERRARYLREAGLRQYTPMTITDDNRLSADIHNGARTGVFSELEEYRRGVGCVAALVPRTAEDERWWALGMSHASGYAPRVREHLATHVQRAAADLAA